jgi:hypothetical protein
MNEGAVWFLSFALHDFHRSAVHVIQSIQYLFHDAGFPKHQSGREFRAFAEPCLVPPVPLYHAAGIERNPPQQAEQHRTRRRLVKEQLQ